MRNPAENVLAVLLVLAFAGCKRVEPTSRVGEERIVVFAAASLREAFTTIGSDFKRAHPGVEVTFNFAGSQELRTALEHGAGSDVFASADTRHMEELVRASRVGAPTTFARNEPIVIVATEAATVIRSFADLPTAPRIIMGAPEVPIGQYTLLILDRASTNLAPDFRSRVEARVVSRELNVRQVLTKVSLGEAQAGFVYRTDAIAVGSQVGIVTIPSNINVIAEYPIAVVTDAAHPQLARAWIDLVLSPTGQRALHEAGFLPPTGKASEP
jgi:molybdate transport system substrate-binding protein